MLQARLQAKAAIVARQEQAAAERQHGAAAAHIRAMFAELDVTTSSIFHSVSSLPAGRLVELAPAYIGQVNERIAGITVDLGLKKAPRTVTTASVPGGDKSLANMTLGDWDAIAACETEPADRRADAAARAAKKREQNGRTNAAKVARDRAQRAAANAAEIVTPTPPADVAPAQSADQVAAEAAALVAQAAEAALAAADTVPAIVAAASAATDAAHKAEVTAMRAARTRR